MDTLTKYRAAVMSRWADYANRCPTPGVETSCVFDEQRDQYLLLSAGTGSPPHVG